VPLCIAGTGIAPDARNKYDEPTANASDLAFDDGSQLMPYFLKS
jgi:2,3-bisphosphoglycerate-independent phosphoglycerate mutase